MGFGVVHELLDLGHVHFEVAWVEVELLVAVLDQVVLLEEMVHFGLHFLQ